MEETAINVENVSKVYKLYEKPINRLKEVLSVTNKVYHKDHFALKDISFQVNKGERIGIIGTNGSGKSTLLKMITGVLTPSSGNITVNGRVSALLELGAGFNPEFTGIENIYLNGTMMGYSREQIDEKMEEIVAFADIGDFVHQPVKMYSSGMFARLAFSVAINVDPDILIVDEALSVGDIYFQSKCMMKMKEMATKCTILIVSHSMDMIKSFCSSAILINKGNLVIKGDVKTVTQTYEKMINQDFVGVKKMKSLEANLSEQKGNNIISKDYEEDIGFVKLANQFRSGSGGAKFIRAELFVDGKKSNVVPFGAVATLRLLIKYFEDVNTEGTVGYMVRNHNGVDVFGMNIYNKAKLLPKMKKNQQIEVFFTFTNCLAESGRYTVSIGLKPKPFEPFYFDSIGTALVFEVSGPENNYVPGLLFVENDMELNVINE
ncbi:ABC transporter ATP-binding protein [Paenibacillus sp. P36]|uniref:ABC transporter ATP-binding protein n=1 Tax=Paenibacillus sp. P36 TaxID=3342538 RepID=UPI0038B2E7D9